MGKHSGSAALRQRLKDLGFADLPKEQVADIFKRFKKVQHWTDVRLCVHPSSALAAVLTAHIMGGSSCSWQM